MTLGVDVGVDTHGDTGRLAQTLGDRLDAGQFASRFDVNRLQTERNGLFELRRRLPDAGEDDLVRLESHAPRHLDLPDGVGIGSAAEPVQQPADGEVGIGFEGVVQGVRVAVERLIERGESFPQKRGAIDVERRAFGGGDSLQLDTVAHEVLVCPIESSHESTSDYTT